MQPWSCTVGCQACYRDPSRWWLSPFIVASSRSWITDVNTHRYIYFHDIAIFDNPKLILWFFSILWRALDIPVRDMIAVNSAVSNVYAGRSIFPLWCGSNAMQQANINQKLFFFIIPRSVLHEFVETGLTNWTRPIKKYLNNLFYSFFFFIGDRRHW